MNRRRPVPQRNIFSVAVRWNKEALLPMFLQRADLPAGLRPLGVKPPLGAATLSQFMSKGIGNQIGMHVYDASPLVDFNLTGFLGEMLRSFRGGQSFREGHGGFDDEIIPIGFLAASLNSPVYLSIPVKDAQIVDTFLDELDTTLAALARHPQAAGWFDFDFDFYRLPLQQNDRRIRCYAVQFGPIKWRLFFARIGNGLYIASKRFILDDLAEAGGRESEAGPTAHAMLRIRPENWKEVLPAFRLGWAESSRQACLNNLGPLSSVARAASASTDTPIQHNDIHRQADQLYAVHFFCPDGGRYLVSPGGKPTLGRRPLRPQAAPWAS